MIFGAHLVIFSKDAEADRAFFANILGFPSVDVGQGWLIFALPPAEVSVHPNETNAPHELYLMCKDLKAQISELKKKGVTCSRVQKTGWGSFTGIRLPGGGKVSIYQPSHPNAISSKSPSLIK
jgi:hypothetical protein